MSIIEIIFTLMMTASLAIFIAIPIARKIKPNSPMPTASIITIILTIIATTITWIIETYNLIILLP